MCDTRDPLSGRGGRSRRPQMGGLGEGPSGGAKTPKKPEKTLKNGVFGGSKIGGKKPEKNTFFDVF